jgi:hypothetical protein
VCLLFTVSISSWRRDGRVALQPVRSAYQPPASSTFLSERISHQQPAATSQQYSSLRTNQHQPSATSQPNRPRALHAPCIESSGCRGLTDGRRVTSLSASPAAPPRAPAAGALGVGTHSPANSPPAGRRVRAGALVSFRLHHPCMQAGGRGR